MGGPRRPESTTEELRQRIREAGLRSTAPRLVVLRWLEGAEHPVSHPELVEALAQEGFDRATLYRNLIDLTEAGLVTRSDLGDHVWRFELRRGGAGHASEAHPHFTCTDCGTVACLPEGSVQLTPSARLPRAVARRAFEVQLRGRCDRCA